MLSWAARGRTRGWQAAKSLEQRGRGIQGIQENRVRVGEVDKTYIRKLRNDMFRLIVVFKTMSSSPFTDFVLFVIRLFDLSRRIFAL